MRLFTSLRSLLTYVQHNVVSVADHWLRKANCTRKLPNSRHSVEALAYQTVLHLLVILWVCWSVWCFQFLTFTLRRGLFRGNNTLVVNTCLHNNKTTIRSALCIRTYLITTCSLPSRTNNKTKLNRRAVRARVNVFFSIFNKNFVLNGAGWTIIPFSDVCANQRWAEFLSLSREFFRRSCFPCS